MNDNNETMFQNIVMRLAKIHGEVYHEHECTPITEALSFLDDLEDMLDDIVEDEHIGIAYRGLISEMSDEVCSMCIQQLRRKCDRIRDKASIIADL